jgi:polyisoprenoid-binding protein YceI
MKLSHTLAVAAAFVTAAHADPLTFDFKDPKGVNNVVFKLDAPLESINGTAHGVSGTVSYDPANPGATTGKIVVATESLSVPNPMMKEHMLGEQWLNAKSNPEITFEIKKISDIEKKADNKGEADVTGVFTLNGVSKEITVDAKVTYLPGRLAERSPQKTPGDLLVIRSEFTIKRSDYNIQPGKNLDKVSDEIELELAIAGAAPKG